MSQFPGKDVVYLSHYNSFKNYSDTWDSESVVARVEDVLGLGVWAKESMDASLGALAGTMKSLKKARS